MTEEQLLADMYVMLNDLKNCMVFESKKLKWIISESLKDVVSTKTIWGIEFAFSKLIEKDCVALGLEEYVNDSMEWERKYLKENNL